MRGTRYSSVRASHLHTPFTSLHCIIAPMLLASQSPLISSLHNIPPEHWDLQEVFSKTKVTCLPPYWPWDCTINVLPRSTLCVGKSTLSQQLRQQPWRLIEEAMEALKQGFIRVISSLAVARFFSVSKKNGAFVSIFYCYSVKPTAINTTPTATCPIHTRAITWCNLFHQAGSAECLQSSMHKKRR